ncbi:hypothetical protein VTN00DRAFT_4863 [Thermoascus crustaceus]|uniref:uncharacterized protein n=1 Tax=Thermoascus crustaceus TaxID=5088 RepID=UPI00374438E9
MPAFEHVLKGLKLSTAKPSYLRIPEGSSLPLPLQPNKDLAAEKTAHTNDLLRLGMENGELRAEMQKLRISLSNAEAALGRRGKGSVTPNKQRPAA